MKPPSAYSWGEKCGDQWKWHKWAYCNFYNEKKKKTSISFAETGFYHNAMRGLKIELSIAFDKHYKQSLKTDFTYFK